MLKTCTFEDLRGKVSVITGGSGIIGFALAEGLASAGVKVAVLSLHGEKADRAAKSLKQSYGIESVGIAADVCDRKALDAAKKEVNRVLGKIDMLINCAGGNSPGATTLVEMVDKTLFPELDKTFFGLDMEGFKQVFDLNLMGTVLPTMVMAPDMVEKGKGAIVNVSSMTAFRALTKVPAYSAAKAAVNNLTRWLAVHFAKVNVRVNAIAPGFFLTEQNRFLLTNEKTGNLTERGKKIVNGTPMGRFGTPDELRGAVLYLLSDLSKFVTGTVLPVDGGFNAFSGV
ncbi:MAG: SDR family oxidoreductase [Spirochaetales bacterium]|nr:SDR family oxidoreductase [Spirochaetales bacterium]